MNLNNGIFINHIIKAGSGSAYRDELSILINKMYVPADEEI